jgi:hypothetical protein
MKVKITREMGRCTLEEEKDVETTRPREEDSLRETKDPRGATGTQE